ncbi:hypothetical protein [Streptomyces chartreusis]|uniref:hypothetical protein n=1 Tax=Streptomyces chartreusis TaxID=1969 RepID=UPI00365FD6D5
MGIADTSIAAAAAALSGVAAFASWRSSREANATASSIAQIERDRWHRELTPQLRLRVDANQQKVYVRFDSPAALKLLQVWLHVRDDRDRSEDPVLGAGPTAAQRAEVIWGPYSFRRGTDGVMAGGRSAGPYRLAAQDMTLVAIEPSHRPTWMEGTSGEDQWRSQYRTAGMRLWADCEAEGHKPWRLSFELPFDGSWAETGAIMTI